MTLTSLPSKTSPTLPKAAPKADGSSSTALSGASSALSNFNKPTASNTATSASVVDSKASHPAAKEHPTGCCGGIKATGSASAKNASTPSSQTCTTVIAKIDVGWGNALYVRGHGGSLSWEKGKLLENKGPSEWMVTFHNLQQPMHLKFLINDQVWAQGENIAIQPGKTLICKPVF